MEPPRGPSDAAQLLQIDAASTFVLTPEGRIACENEPGAPPGPRLFVAGCRGGHVVLARRDVDPAIAARAQALMEAAPPWFEAEMPLPCLDELMALLAPVQAISRSIIYCLPHSVAFEARADFVCSGTPASDALLARLAEAGMPPHLVAAGFVGLEDFWAPWCVALQDGQIAAMAFAARLGEAGAEIGVYTFRPYRGHGLAAAVTARWAALPALAGRALFYSTLVDNHSSQRVAARLGLQRLGAKVRIV